MKLYNSHYLFFCKQKTAYEMRISDWSSDVCSSDLPVNWCFDCGSALAEAEVEYADRVDPAVDVAFPFADKPGLAAAFGLDAVDDGAVVIWTTTPWTIPANQALNVHPEVEYAQIGRAHV